MVRGSLWKPFRFNDVVGYLKSKCLYCLFERGFTLFNTKCFIWFLNLSELFWWCHPLSWPFLACEPYILLRPKFETPPQNLQVLLIEIQWVNKTIVWKIVFIYLTFIFLYQPVSHLFFQYVPYYILQVYEHFLKHLIQGRNSEDQILRHSSGPTKAHKNVNTKRVPY